MIRISSRREFCVNACQLASLAGGAALASACGGSPTSDTSGGTNLTVLNASVAGGVASLTIDASSPLANVGGVALVSAGSLGFLVARTSQTTFNAVTAVCTHEQCTVSQFTGSVYQCPCHGSQFSTSGAVVRGPAAAALSSRATAFSGNVLTITV